MIPVRNSSATKEIVCKFLLIQQNKNLKQQNKNKMLENLAEN